MEDPEHPIAAALGVIVIATIVASIALVAAGGWEWFAKFLEGSAPAWVQAVGSVGAILAAIWVANRQNEHARILAEQKRIKEEIRRLEVIRALMARSVILARDVTRALTEVTFENLQQVDPIIMRDTSDTIGSIPIFEVPEGLLTLDMRSVARALSVLADCWDDFREEASRTLQPDGPVAADVLRLAGEIQEIAKAAFDSCRTHVLDRRNGRQSAFRAATARTDRP